MGGRGFGCVIRKRESRSFRRLRVDRCIVGFDGQRLEKGGGSDRRRRVPTIGVIHRGRGFPCTHTDKDVMPQLDAATYLSQVFWLGLTFGGYYLLSITYVIPTLSRRVKVRGKKLGAGKGAAQGAVQEESQVRESFAGTVSTGGRSSGELLQQGRQRRDQWLRTEQKGLQGSQRSKANQAYLQGLGTVQATQVVRKKG
jgi:hypothetical protein